MTVRFWLSEKTWDAYPILQTSPRLPVRPPMKIATTSRLRLGHPARMLVFVLVLAFGLNTTGCSRGVNPISGNKRLYGYSWEQERQLGQEADQQIMQQYGLYDDEALQQYVTRIGERVLAESVMRQPGTPAQFRNTPFTFRVLDSPVVNAFALPGGYIYVTRGLMAHLNNEAQLAVVLGHEITHVAARHASAQAAKQQLAQLGLVGGAIVGQEALGLPAQDLLDLGGQTAQLLLLSYSRENENESDNNGVEWAGRAGYAVGEGAEFFRSLERIQEESGQSLPTWMSSHPDPGNREQRIRQMADEMRQQGMNLSMVGQDAFYRQIEGLVLGENPRQGFTESGTFYHPDLAFRFPVPRGFRVQNGTSAVMMVDPNQQAQVVFTFADAESPQAAVRALAQQVQQSEGARLVDQGASRTDGGQPAQYALVEMQNQQGQRVRLLVYYLEYDGTVYAFQAAAASSNFSSFQDTFTRTMRGFEPLTDRRILNVQPTRLNVANASRTASFQSFIDQGALPPDMDVQRLAIVNQVDLASRIEAGTPVKLPRR